VTALYAWLGRHPRLVDAALAAPLALTSLATALVAHRYAQLLATLVLTGAIIVRRSLPVEAFATAIGVGAVQVAFHIGLMFADLAIVILLYTLAAYTTRRKSVIGLAVCLAGSAVGALVLRPVAIGTSTGGTPRIVPLSETQVLLTELAAGAILFAAPTLIAWVLGDSMRYRRAYYANLEEKAARLERDRDAQATIAAAAERARIARELHDVVAHNVSVMVVQADGAAYAIDADRERARNALNAISATGRQALAEMRVMLGVLRQNDENVEATRAPVPGLSQLDDLLDQTRTAGLPVLCRVDGTPQPLPDGTALAAYRIIQESLTNARKHAGPLARAEVLLAYGADDVEITVTDDGIGGAAPCDGAGHGLTGMRERAAIFGGSVQAGPIANGGYRVIARLPLATARMGAT
jgi:signal transduction histidine kinase